MAFFAGATKDQMRAEQLLKRRQQEHEQMEQKKKKIEEENRMQAIEEKFKAHYDAVEQMLKTDTVGLVSLDEMKKKQEDIIHAREQQLAREKEAKLNELNKNKQGNRKDASGHQRPNKLSFADEWDEEEDEEEQEKEKEKEKEKEEQAEKPTVTTSEEVLCPDENSTSNDVPSHEDGDGNESPGPTPAEMDRLVAAATTRKRLGKNPDVDTSFLPDRDREEEERILREKLRQEWVEKQQKLKNEEVDLVFSYWDGSGHRRSMRIKKRTTIQMFLTKALEILRRENAFNELKTASVDQLIFVKDDVILPQHYSFYDLIVTRARGRTGPLFLFTEMMKLPTAIVEVPATATTTTGLSTTDGTPAAPATNEGVAAGSSSHAGKICLRSWYERNKHIFPACRWEPYDPEKRWSAHEPPKNRFCVK